jgi:hypothetical protein
MLSLAFTIGDLIELVEFPIFRKYSAQPNRAPHFVLECYCLQITAERTSDVELAQCRNIFYPGGKKSAAVLIEASKVWNCSIMEQEYQHPQLSTPNSQPTDCVSIADCILYNNFYNFSNGITVNLFLN